MCGFAGIVTWDERYRVDRETLRRMSAAVAHRGPDGEGEYFNHHEQITSDRPQVALAFRRLAILDPDPRSNQPFHLYDPTGRPRLTLVFNGEIYNYRELRNELTHLRPDYQWRTTGDTEVLLVAYDVWREKCVEHFNGMFAFAVWDEREKTVFLARDRMGQKPLFVASPMRWPYHRGDNKHSEETGGGEGASSSIGLYWSLAFASELRALNELEWLDQKLDKRACMDYLRFGYFYAPTTIYQDIKKMPPASWLKLSAHKEWRGTYYAANAVASASVDPNPRTTKDIVVQSVGHQLVSDVPLGCFLSGGIDSSVIAACMKRTAADVLTFSIGFDDPRYDESRYAADVALHLGTKHHAFVVRPRAADDLPKLAMVFGEPFADSSALPTHYLARETRQYVKVALSGDGGDELFGGYDRYRAMQLGQRLQRVPQPLREQVGRMLQRMPGTHPKSVAVQIRRLLGNLQEPPAHRYRSYVMLFCDQLLPEIWADPKRVHDSPWMIEDYVRLLAGRDIVQAALATDRVTYLPDDLLTKIDRASMLHALEVRSPFMDHELVQFAAGLTTDQLLKGGPKRMLREAFKDDLPTWVFKRRKMGFAVPIGEWFRTDPNLRAMLRDNLFAADSFARQHFNMPVVQRLIDEHEQQRIDHSQRLYALLMLELWWRNQK
jgi:asparagine synthase (glutamine-hydrolysing)